MKAGAELRTDALIPPLTPPPLRTLHSPQTTPIPHQAPRQIGYRIPALPISDYRAHGGGEGRTERFT
jgi:hypothetical protein